MRDFLKEKKSRIINLFYNNDHNHIYSNKYFGYNRDLYHIFKCVKCDHQIEIVFIEFEDDMYSEDFVEDGCICEYDWKGSFYICYLGRKAMFDELKNNEMAKEMLSCHECIIKNIIE